MFKKVVIIIKSKKNNNYSSYSFMSTYSGVVKEEYPVLVDPAQPHLASVLHPNEWSSANHALELGHRGVV